MIQFSLLISVYAKDDPKFLNQALKSIKQQSLVPDQIVLVEDGSLTASLNNSIEDCTAQFAHIQFDRIKLESNLGLANALNVGLKHCRHEWVARMDSDDFSVQSRFEDQIRFIEKHPDYSVVGGWTEQRDTRLERILGYKKHPVSHDEIHKKSKWRCPMAHVSVMFRKDHVIDAGSYDIKYTSVEDYALWSTMLVRGYKFANIDKVLVQVRSGKEMIYRRGGRDYFRKEKSLLRYQNEIGLLTKFELMRNLMIRIAFRFLPAGLRYQITYRFLRTKTE